MALNEPPAVTPGVGSGEQVAPQAFAPQAEQPAPAVLPPKGPLRWNALANLSATSWATLLNLLFVPVYLNLMGVEAYGLVGFFATLQATLALLDLGVTPTTSRYMAQYSVDPSQAQEARDLVRTLESWYWALALLIGVAVTALAGPIATSWLNNETLPTETVRTALLLMGLMAAVQWPASLYAGGLQGLQRQVTLAGLYIGYNTVRHVGAALVLWLLSGSVTAFFAWQLLVSTVYTLLLVLLFWRAAPGKGLRASFRMQALRSVWRFAAGMTGMALLRALQTQGDKLILSRMLTLREFAYYALAATVANALLILSDSINMAVFPRFTQMATSGAKAALTALFRLVARIQSASIGVIGLVVILFAAETVLLWTGSSETMEAVAPLLALLAGAGLFTALASSSYRLALAYGWTRLGVQVGLVHLLFYFPLLIVLTQRWGALGAAWAGLVTTGLIQIVFAWLTQRRLLPGNFVGWATRDVAPALLAALAVLLPGRLLLHPAPARPAALVALAAVSSLALLAGALAVPDVRRLLAGRLALVTSKAPAR